VRFDNFRVTFTGQALYNRYIVDQTGIGNSQEMNLPLAGMSVEARTDTGATVGSAITDANGNFMLAAVGVQPSVVGSIVVTSAGSACAVRKALNGPLYAVTLLSGVSFANDLNVGVLTLSDSNDPGGVNRQPINIVRAIQSVYAYATSKTAKAIPRSIRSSSTSRRARRRRTRSRAARRSRRCGSVRRPPATRTRGTTP
jgi:hypothetical protein